MLKFQSSTERQQRDRSKAVWIFNVTDMHTASYITVSFPNHTFAHSSQNEMSTSFCRKFAQFPTKPDVYGGELCSEATSIHPLKGTLNLQPLVENTAIKPGAQHRNSNPFGFLGSRNLLDLSHNEIRKLSTRKREDRFKKTGINRATKRVSLGTHHFIES